MQERLTALLTHWQSGTVPAVPPLNGFPLLLTYILWHRRVSERLAIAAATTPPMPYHLLKLAEARW